MIMKSMKMRTQYSSLADPWMDSLRPDGIYHSRGDAWRFLLSLLLMLRSFQPVDTVYIS